MEILNKQKAILDKVQFYININLNPKKNNFLDPSKSNFKSLDSISDILNLLNITLQDYESALSISADDDYQIHLKRKPNSCFINNYFPEGLSAWEANIDLQPVFNYYKAVTYMCAYFSKSEEKCSVAMKEALTSSQRNGCLKI